MNIIDQAHSLRPRLEQLLVAQMELRRHPHANPGHLFEVERAIDELTDGWPNAHTACVEAWVAGYIGGAR